MKIRHQTITAFCLGLAASGMTLFAATGEPPYASGLDVTASIFRLIGGLLVVFSLFFGGVWVVKNSARWKIKRGPAPRLRVLESRAIGNRQSLCVVSFEERRFLIGSSPAGIHLISQLSDADSGQTSKSKPDESFADALHSAWGSRG